MAARRFDVGRVEFSPNNSGPLHHGPFPPPKVEGIKGRRITPNRMKFASLVSKLDPQDPDFAVRVADYQQQYEDRAAKIESLRAMLHGTVDCDGPHKILAYDADAVEALKQELADAIERFVVDRY